MLNFHTYKRFFCQLLCYCQFLFTKRHTRRHRCQWFLGKRATHEDHVDVVGYASMLCTDGCLSQVLAVFESFSLYLHTCWQRYRCEAVATLEGVRIDKFQTRRHRHLCQSCVLEGVHPNGRYRLREVDVCKRLAVFKGSGVYLVDVLWQRNLC